jgi:hypothetical protein
MSQRRACATTRGLFLLAISALGCNAILGIENGHPKAKDAGEDVAAAGDGATPAEAAIEEASLSDAEAAASAVDAPSTCAGARAPLRPNRDDDPNGAVMPFVLAMETFQFDDDGRIGFDLDGRCTTCPDALPSSCNLRAAPTPLVCDGIPDGRDLTGNAMLDQLVAEGETAFSQKDLQQGLDAGAHGALLRISRYNGRADDQAVTLEFFGETWMPPQEGGAQPLLRRDGSDEWTVYQESVILLNASAEQDLSAYVSDYTLVAHLAKATIALRPGTGTNDNGFIMHLRDVTLTAKLEPSDGGGYRAVGGNFGGRWEGNDILKSFGALATEAGSICGSHPFYLFLRAQVCAALDIMADQANDNTNQTCNAVSFGLGFTAGPARIADTPLSPIVAPGTCGDDWNPTCD